MSISSFFWTLHISYKIFFFFLKTLSLETKVVFVDLIRQMFGKLFGKLFGSPLLSLVMYLCYQSKTLLTMKGRSSIII